MKTFFNHLSVLRVLLAVPLVLAVSGGGVWAESPVCVDTNGVKYYQPPNPTGYDISDGLGYILADDFVCTNTGPVSEIHIFGSWLGDTNTVITNFWLAIYSDVAAVTNPASGMVTPSHPGSLLWSASFGLSQFVGSVVGIGQEQFITPASVNVVGPDTQIWQYCFTPTNPFTQQGSTAAPTVYWLAAYAQPQIVGSQYYQAPQYGWKTTPVVQNDVSVYTLWTGALPGPGSVWNQNAAPQNSPAGSQPLDLAFELTTPTNAPAPCCPAGNTIKYLQPPNLENGIDIDANVVRGGYLADDFPCSTTGPITDIHIWGSWLNDVEDPTATFQLAIWSDVPAVASTGANSHPGSPLWQQTFPPGSYDLCPYYEVPEPFDDPNYNAPIPPTLNSFGASTNLYQVCFYPTNPFVQQGTPNQPTNYWLSVSESSSNQSGPLYFGWKTSPVNYNDPAVYTLHPSSGPWTSFINADGAPYNLAFQINTETNVPQPVECTETNGVKYIQGPNVLGGLDVWDTPYVLADDFVCTNPGAISDIHLWGSWLNNQALTNSIDFWLGIFDDVPVGPNNLYSHPGTNLLWQQWFAPGQYAETIWTANASEQFLDPGATNILGSDSIVWYYCFYPTNPFVQAGTVTSAKIYWLAAYAQLPVGIADLYGWKTTTNVLNDTSVHAVWQGVPLPTNVPAWTPTVFQNAAGGPTLPLDLAFKLTTPTNCSGPIQINYLQTNLVVLTWGTGILQAATNVTGPYLDIPGASSPYTNNTTTTQYRYYRLRCN